MKASCNSCCGSSAIACRAACSACPCRRRRPKRCCARGARRRPERFLPPATPRGRRTLIKMISESPCQWRGNDHNAGINTTRPCLDMPFSKLALRAVNGTDFETSLREHITELCRPHGKVARIDVYFDEERYPRNGVAIVDFENHDQLAAVIRALGARLFAEGAAF